MDEDRRVNRRSSDGRPLETVPSREFCDHAHRLFISVLLSRDRGRCLTLGAQFTNPITGPGVEVQGPGGVGRDRRVAWD